MLPPPVPELPAHLVCGAALLPSRAAILPLLPKNKVIVEVGVGLGWFSNQLLWDCTPSRFIAIDTFRLHENPDVFGMPAAERFGSLTHREYYAAEIEQHPGGAKVILLEGDSAEMLATLEDESADIIYIDGDHGYHAVARDLIAASRKIKPDGYLIVNDYILTDQLHADQPYGVIYATNEFMLAHHWALQYFALQTNMFCDVVLRKPAALAQETTRVEDLQSRLRAAQDELRLLRQSTSWRLTAPLRSVKKILRHA
jgi:precorrin-6B methylase 2